MYCDVSHRIAKSIANAEITSHLYILETSVKSHGFSIIGKLYLVEHIKVAMYAWKKDWRTKTVNLPGIVAQVCLCDYLCVFRIIIDSVYYVHTLRHLCTSIAFAESQSYIWSHIS